MWISPKFFASAVRRSGRREGNQKTRGFRGLWGSSPRCFSEGRVHSLAAALLFPQNLAAGEGSAQGVNLFLCQRVSLEIQGF